MYTLRSMEAKTSNVRTWCGIEMSLCSVRMLVVPGAGNVSSLLQYLEKGHDSADVQFWKRLADPVLVHDSFSTFIWLLFCLPLPFPANGAPFTALVHLFYLVCVTQVLAPPSPLYRVLSYDLHCGL